MTDTKKSSGLVLPPGSVPPVTQLEAGSYELKIIDLFPENGVGVPSENDEARVQYPDGNVRGFQVRGLDSLLPQIVSYFRGHYGAQSIEFTAVPKALAKGAIITVELK